MSKHWSQTEDRHDDCFPERIDRPGAPVRTEFSESRPEGRLRPRKADPTVRGTVRTQVFVPDLPILTVFAALFAMAGSCFAQDARQIMEEVQRRQRSDSQDYEGTLEVIGGG